MSKEFRLKNDALYLSVETPGGIYNSQQLQSIAKLCDEQNIIAKLTEDQRISIVVNESELPAIAQALNEVGLGLRHYQDGIHQPVSCIGGLCSFACQDALDTSIKVSEALAKLETSSPFKTGINGCLRNCVATHTLDISLIGDEDGYKLYLGGRNKQLPQLANFAAEGIPADAVPDLLVKIIKVYNNAANEGESINDVVERLGLSTFIDALEPYSQSAMGEIPANSELDAGQAEDLTPNELDVEDEDVTEKDDEPELIEAQEDFESSPEEDVEEVGHTTPEEEAKIEERLTESIEEMDNGDTEAETEQKDKRRDALRIVETAYAGQMKEDEYTPSAKSFTPSHSFWEVTSVNLLHNQQDLVISFQSGASLQLSFANMKIGERTLNFGDKTISIVWSEQMIVLESDEMKLTLPRQAA